MKKEYRLSVLGISLIFQLFAYIQSRLIPDSVSISPNWFSQFPYLLVILITASVAAGLTERINVIVILLIIRSIIFIITGLPLGAYKEIELILLLSILIETSLYLEQFAQPLTSIVAMI